MKHSLRGRPQGHLQCTECRAGFLSKESARLSSTRCLGFKLPHGLTRDHVVYPTWYDQGSGYGPDRLCDEPNCFCQKHECDCDVCEGHLRVPSLNVLLDSREGEPRKESKMAGIEMHLPATLRKHIVRNFEPETQAGYDLVTACKALDMGNSMHSTTVKVSNASLGIALDICREWKADSTNGNEVQTAKTVLTRHELDHEPEDPRERRHEIKFPGSLAGYLGKDQARGQSPEVLEDLDRCNWSKSGANGRVRYATLTWMLEKAESCSIHLSGPEQRAGKKFLATHLPAWEETGRLVAKHEKAVTMTDQAPAEVDVIEDQDQDAGTEFPAAVEGEHQEEDQADPQATPRGPVPENFVWMAENADTETARAWWTRKVQQWGR